MLKVMTIVGTRPEVIRLSCTIRRLDAHCNHVLVHTGQNYDYELNDVFFKELGIRSPDYYLNAAGRTPAETIGKVIATTDEIMVEQQPDAVLLLGDTNSSLSAITAKRRKIPIFHMEAGNRCFDFRVPEEINRRIVDHISDINLTYSQIARDYLLREGLPPDQVICIGSPMREVLGTYQPQIEASTVLQRLGLTPSRYMVVSSHREENVDVPDRLQRLVEALGRIAERYEEPIIFSTHPRTRKQLESMRIESHPRIHFLPPFGFPDYVKLQTSARAVLSDSGTITEESSILGFPALNIRDVHERPEGAEEAAVMMVGLDGDLILNALEILDSSRSESQRRLPMVRDYEPSNVSEKILRIIVSYTGFVNRKVWRKFY